MANQKKRFQRDHSQAYAISDPSSVGVKINERNHFFLCFIDGQVKLGPFKKRLFDKTW